MYKFKEYNRIIGEEFCNEMKKFEEKPTFDKLKAIKELSEVWANLQCVEAGEAMRKIARRDYGYGEDMGEWDEDAIFAVYDAARGGRGGRRRSRETGRYISNRGGRGGMYNTYDDDDESRGGMYDTMYPPMYNRQDRRERHNGHSGERNPNPNEMYMLRQQDGMPIWTPYAKHEKGDIPKKLTKEQIKDWMSDLENEDGTTGEHWNEQQIEQVAQKLNIKFEDFSKESFAAAMNIMYSDYCKTLDKYGVNKPEVYAHLAKDFLEDEDYPGADGNEKLAAYYFLVMQKD